MWLKGKNISRILIYTKGAPEKCVGTPALCGWNICSITVREILEKTKQLRVIGFKSCLFQALDVVYLCCIFMLYINERKLVDRYENSCDNRSIEWYGT